MASKILHDFVGKVEEVDDIKVPHEKDRSHKLGMKIQSFGWMSIFGSEVEIEDAAKEITKGVILKGQYSEKGKYKNIESWEISEGGSTPPQGGTGVPKRASDSIGIKEFQDTAIDVGTAMAATYSVIATDLKLVVPPPSTEDIRAMAISSIIETGNRFARRR